MPEQVGSKKSKHNIQANRDQEADTDIGQDTVIDSDRGLPAVPAGEESVSEEQINPSAPELPNGLVRSLKNARTDEDRRELLERHYDLIKPGQPTKEDLFFAQALSAADFYHGCEELTLFVYKGQSKESPLGEAAMYFQSLMHENPKDEHDMVQFGKIKDHALAGNLFKLAPKRPGQEQY